MYDKETIKTFTTVQHCDMCGSPERKMIHFASIKADTTNYLMWYVCFRCFSGRVPVMEGEPSYGEENVD